ncbi:MAG TPA: BLUF domain-containing protein [Sphingomonas sp.]|nr:BLUF domain-containing protein [Sphingomonas sp.]
MLQITYISTARPGLPATAIEDILEASRRNNAAAGITGLLLYDGYRFMQALEGDDAQVVLAFDLIKADPRHRAVVLLSTRVVQARAFGNWEMAGQRVSIASGETVPELIDSLTEEVADPIMRDLFRSFARIRRAA